MRELGRVLLCFALSAFLVQGLWNRHLGRWLASGPPGRSMPAGPQRIRPAYSILRDRNLSRLSLAGKQLMLTGFYSTKMDKASFKGASSRGSMFFHTSLERADFSGARLLSANFQSCDLQNASFQGASLKNSLFADVNLRDADFRAADLRGAVILLSSLQGATFNDKTKLPFPDTEALRRGMRHVD